MALIFLGILIFFMFQVLSSPTAVTSSPMMSGPLFARPQSTGLSGLGEILVSYYGTSCSRN